MLKNIKSKKGIAPVFIFMIITLALLGIYLLLYIPIPAFTKLRVIINYFLILIWWILFQGLLIYGYYKLVSFAVTGIKLYRKKMITWTTKAKNLISGR